MTRDRLAPLTVLLATACVASKGDIRLLQDELRSLHSAVAHADTLQRVRADSAMQLIVRANDSLKALSGRVNVFQATTSGELYDMSQQLVQIQELTGQGQRRLQDLRAQIEAQHEAAISAATPPSAGDTTKPAVPGPATLYVSSLDQFRRGSYGVARAGFQQLLAQYPKYEAAPLAQEYIGERFSAERNDAAADSVYQVVLTRYPTSSAAPTALYKRAELLQVAGKEQESKALLQRLVRDYPKSDAAGLAREQLGMKK